MNGHRDFHVVIGMNFGDEGKGRVVKHLVRTSKVDLVVKHNGGSQAGHTVVGPDGERFVHSQLGSGAMFGVKTYLADTFQFNPLLLEKELNDLEKLIPGQAPLVLVDANARVTFTMDMMINQLRESDRGDERHGSCGHGIFEAFDRARDGLFVTAAGMNGMRADELDRWCERAMKRYLHKFGDLIPNEREFRVVARDGFMAAGEALYRLVAGERVRVVGAMPEDAKTVVFECGQGLGLDMNNIEHFPHLTPSNTGAMNVAKYFSAGDVERFTLHYVTRPYVTRHGRGRLDHEMTPEEFSSRFPDFVDETNVPNPWQGSLRFGRLSSTQMKRTLVDTYDTFNEIDARYRSEVAVNRVVHVTCAAQGPELVHEAGTVSLTDLDAVHDYFTRDVCNAETVIHYGE